MKGATCQHGLDPLNEGIGERSERAEEENVHQIDQEEQGRLHRAVRDKSCDSKARKKETKMGAWFSIIVLLISIFLTHQYVPLQYLFATSASTYRLRYILQQYTLRAFSSAWAAFETSP